MFQKEVAHRICAGVGDDAYGRLSIISQWRSHAVKMFDVSPQAFTPPPKVTSSIVHITPRTRPVVDCDVAVLEKVTAAAFGQRRKMLRSSLKTWVVIRQPLLNKPGLNRTCELKKLMLPVSADWQRLSACDLKLKKQVKPAACRNALMQVTDVF